MIIIIIILNVSQTFVPYGRAVRLDLYLILCTLTTTSTTTDRKRKLRHGRYICLTMTIKPKHVTFLVISNCVNNFRIFVTLFVGYAYEDIMINSTRKYSSTCNNALTPNIHIMIIYSYVGKKFPNLATTIKMNSCKVHTPPIPQIGRYNKMYKQIHIGSQYNTPISHKRTIKCNYGIL